jgi:hypothetical protein
MAASAVIDLAGVVIMCTAPHAQINLFGVVVRNIFIPYVPPGTPPVFPDLSVPGIATLSRADAPGYPQQQMAADGTVHALLGEGSLRAREDLGRHRSWTRSIRFLTLADYTLFQTFYYTTVYRSVRAFYWTNRANGEQVLVRFSPTSPPQWTPVENHKDKFRLDFTLIEA